MASVLHVVREHVYLLTVTSPCRSFLACIETVPHMVSVSLCECMLKCVHHNFWAFFRPGPDWTGPDQPEVHRCHWIFCTTGNLVPNSVLPRKMGTPSGHQALPIVVLFYGIPACLLSQDIMHPLLIISCNPLWPVFSLGLFRVVHHLVSPGNLFALGNYLNSNYDFHTTIQTNQHLTQPIQCIYKEHLGQFTPCTTWFAISRRTLPLPLSLSQDIIHPNQGSRV